MSIPNCVPEFYRSEQEKFDREYEKQHRLDDFYEECKARIEEAHEKGYILIPFGGYSVCRDNCKKHSGEMMTNPQDDMCTIICYDKNCKFHHIYELISGIAELIQKAAKDALSQKGVDVFEFNYENYKFEIHRAHSGFEVLMNGDVWYVESFDGIYEVLYMLLENEMSGWEENDGKENH